MNACKVSHDYYQCGECGEEYDDEEDAEACCRDDEDVEESETKE